MARGWTRPASQDVGAVVALTPSGTVTVRAHSAAIVPEGTSVADARGAFQGRVVRVFGPVARPYYSVRPRRPPSPAEGAQLLGAELHRA
ncbi:MAG TPA: H/ACA RNA-protein complex component Gar1 [Thermoplasmata archaeon]|nr:H/ACA RNA-protein complex component Gar1 [Thermoplasmata archaeon]